MSKIKKEINKKIKQKDNDLSKFDQWFYGLLIANIILLPIAFICLIIIVVLEFVSLI